jgi:two-component system LytT family response regulator
VTAFDRYAVKAFESHALDYLLKPFKRHRFFEAVRRAKEQLQAAPATYGDKLNSLLEKLKPSHDRLVFKSAGKIVVIRPGEVDWVEAAANYVRIHVGSQEHAVRDTISNFEKKLPADRFLRIHRSVIVNADRIHELQPCNGAEYIVVLRSGKELPVGRTYRDQIENFLHIS